MTKYVISLYGLIFCSLTVDAQEALEFLPETESVQEVTEPMEGETSPWEAIKGLDFLDDVEPNLNLDDDMGQVMPAMLPTFDILEDRPFFVKFRVLNTKNDQMKAYTLNKDGGVYHDNILITVRNCVPDYKEQAQNDIAFFEVQDAQNTDAVFFRGWMFKNYPSASALEHPVYEIFFDSCEYTEIQENEDLTPDTDVETQ